MQLIVTENIDFKIFTILKAIGMQIWVFYTGHIFFVNMHFSASLSPRKIKQQRNKNNRRILDKCILERSTQAQLSNFSVTQFSNFTRC